MELNEFRKRQLTLIVLSSLTITWIICFSFDLRDVWDMLFTFAVVSAIQLCCLHITTNDLIKGTQDTIDNIKGTQSSEQIPDYNKTDYESTEVKSKNVSEDKYFYFPYVNGFAIVIKETLHYDGNSEKSYSFIDKKGEYITDKWYQDVMDFNEYGVAIVYDGSVYNIIDNQGKELSLNWFYNIAPFKDGLAKVRWNDGTVNYIDNTGKLAWSKWKEDTPSVLDVAEN